ncbi:hypothetical protein M758_UG175300 [Ceratodon purpureus]|nr:hypothetical protein M758_UG175300 [Ceratodon purpureus]
MSVRLGGEFPDSTIPEGAQESSDGEGPENNNAQSGVQGGSTSALAAAFGLPNTVTESCFRGKDPVVDVDQATQRPRSNLKLFKRTTENKEEQFVSERPRAVSVNTAKKTPALQIVPARMPFDYSAADVVESTQRPKRTRKRPSKYLEYITPSENKLRGEECRPLTPRNKAVWILHRDHQNQTIALGRCGPHWRSYKKKIVPNVC